MEKFTIEAWILTRSEEKQIIVEKGSTWNRDGEFALLFYTNRRPVVQARDLPDNCDDEAVGVAIRANTWTHLAGIVKSLGSSSMAKKTSIFHVQVNYGKARKIYS